MLHLQKILFGIILLFAFNSLAQNNPCLEIQDFKIVVLGSSTSAGAGASASDSAWVNRYRSYLQDINPNNEVVNLGVGGYNTYRIMRTGFVPPVGRPNPDPSKNITAAINEAPDAIIVNMPSNDVSSGFTLLEQMDNLDSIAKMAEINGIPIWICTTQPKNYSNATQLNLQWDVKDSIYAHFSPYTIDFWTTIAMSDHTINPTYDSGDGTHLNDLGHGLLFQRVIDVHILDSIYQSPTTVDFVMQNVLAITSPCGDSSSIIQVVIGNIGIDNFDSTEVQLSLQNVNLGTSYSDNILLQNGLSSCVLDTLSFIVNTYSAGTYEITTVVWNGGDSTLENDSLTVNFVTSGHPDVALIGDTLCDVGSASLTATFSSQDTIFWYDDPLAITPIGTGTVFNSSFIDTTSSFYAQVVRGNLFYTDELHTTETSTINWNGTMFDIVAHEELFIDSFDVKIASLGMQGIEIYYKLGSYQGFELDATAWTLLDDATLNVVSDSTWTTVPIGGLTVLQNDTVGIYIQMTTPSSTLSYTSVGNEQVRSTPELTMITGSGIGHNHSSLYYPRDMSGGVYYHFGERPLGDCSTEIEEVVAFVNTMELVAGNDTILDITDTLWITATPNMATYSWFDGSTNSNIEIIAADLGVGVHYIDLYTTDSIGCDHFDQFVVAVADLVGIQELEQNISLYPNPTSSSVTINCPENAIVSFMSINGKYISVPPSPNNTYDLSELVPGIYTVHIGTDNGVIVKKIVKSN